MRHPKDHYLPAAYLGGFSNSEERRLRKRTLWAARRHVGQAFRQSAENLGYSRGLYRLEEPIGANNDVNFAWERSEAELPRAMEELAQAAHRGTQIPARAWAKLVPFIAGLFVRAPEFEARFEARMEDLLGDGFSEMLCPDNTQTARLFELQRLYAPVMHAEWKLLINTSRRPLITNDLGYMLMAGPAPSGADTSAKVAASTDGLSPGDIAYFVPLSRDIAAILRFVPDRRVIVWWDEQAADWWVDLESFEVNDEQVADANRDLAASGLVEIYGARRDVVMAAHAGFELHTPRCAPGGTFLADAGARDREMDFFKLLTVLGGELEEAVALGYSVIERDRNGGG